MGTVALGPCSGGPLSGATTQRCQASHETTARRSLGAVQSPTEKKGASLVRLAVACRGVVRRGASGMITMLLHSPPIRFAAPGASSYQSPAPLRSLPPAPSRSARARAGRRQSIDLSDDHISMYV